MKIIGYLLAVVLLLATAFVTLAAANKSHHLASELSGLFAMFGDHADAKSADLPSTMRLNLGALIGAIGGIASLILLVATFAKKQWIGALASVTIACAAITAAVYPYIPTGPGDGAAPRPMALVAIGLAAVGAFGSWLATRARA